MFKKMPNTSNLLYTMLVAVLFFGCNKGKEVYTKKFLVAASNDNKWTTTAGIECDSFNMESRTKITLYIDGHKSNFEAQIIKIASNPYYVAPK